RWAIVVARVRAGLGRDLHTRSPAPPFQQPVLQHHLGQGTAPESTRKARGNVDERPVSMVLNPFREWIVDVATSITPRSGMLANSTNASTNGERIRCAASRRGRSFPAVGRIGCARADSRSQWTSAEWRFRLVANPRTRGKSNDR